MKIFVCTSRLDKNLTDELMLQWYIQSPKNGVCLQVWMDVGRMEMLSLDKNTATLIDGTW